MDDIGERAPLYAAFYVAPNRDTIVPMLNMDPVLIANCNGVRNNSGCYDIVSKIISHTIFE
jgi:hypothetical protein